MSNASALERQMLALINEERTSRGLQPLQLEQRLNDSAEDHSEWMLQTDTFSHTGQGGSSATARMRDAGFQFSGAWRSGENIAWQSERGPNGASDDVVQLHQSLMNSPGHRANILNPNFKYIGIGIEEGDFNGWDAVIVTQNFATTSAPVLLDTGASGGAPNPAPSPSPTPAPVPVPDETPEPDLTPVRQEVWAGTQGTAQDDWLVLRDGSAGVLDGRNGADTLVGKGGSDTLLGRYGFDTLIGNNGNDKIYAGHGNDKAYGGNNNDLIYGGVGQDLLYGGNGQDRLFGGDGADTAHGGAGWDQVQGGNGNDDLSGGDGNDRLSGQAGNDDLDGGNGNDWLFGGLGDNVLTGGSGADDFVFGYGDQRVTDFDADEGDQVFLKFVKSSIQNYQDLMNNHISQRGSDVVIEDDNGYQLVLEDTSLSELSNENFLF